MNSSDSSFPNVPNLPGSSNPSAAQLQADIARLHHDLNTVAQQLSQCDTPPANQLWHSLAQARAYLATALEQSRHLKDDQLRSILNWEI